MARVTNRGKPLMLPNRCARNSPALRAGQRIPRVHRTSHRLNKKFFARSRDVGYGLVVKLFSVSRRFFILLVCFSLLPLSWAQESESLPPVIERYEQMLVRNPSSAVAFDRVYAHYQKTAGVEALEKRWAAFAENQPEQRAAWQLLAALAADRAGRDEVAAEGMARAAKSGADDYRILMAVTDHYLRLGELDEALAVLDQALALDVPPLDQLDLQRKQARTLARNLQDNEAAAAWLALANSDEADDLLVEEAAEALLEMGQYESAAEQFERLREMAARNPFKQVQAMMRLATVSERQNEMETALDYYESALPLVSETSWMHHEVRTRIEDLYRRRDDLPGLIAYYEGWLEEHPKDVSVVRRLSDVQFEMGNQQEGLNGLRDAAELAPENREIQVQLAERLLDQDAFDEAALILEKVVAADPSEMFGWQMLGSIRWAEFEATGSKEARTAALDAWSHLAPDDVEAPEPILALAELLETRGALEEAEATLKRAVDVAPNLLEPRQRLAQFYLSQDRSEAAWPLFDPLLQQEKPPVELFTMLSRLRERASTTEDALAVVERGLTIYPDQFDLRQLKLRHLEALERWDAAIAQAEQMAKDAPNAYARDDVERQLIFFYRAADQAESRLASLRDELAEASLTPHDQRVLVRLAIQASEVRLAREAAAHEKAGLPVTEQLRLQLAVEKAFGTADSQITLLKQLIDVEPRRAADSWRAMVRIHQEQGDYSAALESAESLLKVAPADPLAYLLFANVAQLNDQPDLAIAKLQEATVLSDQPQAIWRRIAEIESARNDQDAAIAALEQAFAAEESNTAKLGIVSALAETYANAGRLDELLHDYRERQNAEGGWRYALYEAAIHASLQNYSSAREALSKVIAQRPDDRDLIRQALALARNEGNRAEVVRWLERLHALDPSPDHLIELAKAQLENQQPDDAVQLLAEQQETITQDVFTLTEAVTTLLMANKPGAARQFLRQLRMDPESDLEAQLALARIRIIAQDGEVEASLWQLWREGMSGSRRPDPPDALAQASVPSSSARTRNGWWNLGNSSKFQGLLFTSRQYWQGVVGSLQKIENAMRGVRSYSSSSRRSSLPPGSLGNQLPSDAALEAAMKALTLLKLKAVATSTEETLIAALEKELDRIAAQPAERLLNWSVLGFPPQTLKSVQLVMQDDASSSDADVLALMNAMQLLMTDALEEEEQEALQEDTLAMVDDLIQEHPGRRQALLMAKLQLFNRLDQQEQAEAISQQLLESLEPTSAREYVQATSLALNIEDYEKALEFYRKLQSEANAAKGTLSTRYRPAWQAMQIGNALLATDAPENQERGIDLLVEAITEEIASGTTGGRHRRSQSYYAQTSQPYPQQSYSLPQQDAAMVQNLASNAGFRSVQETILAEATNRLNQDEAEPGGWIRLGSLAWLIGEREQAIAHLETARTRLQGTNQRQLWNAVTMDLATQHLALKEPAKALALLESVEPRKREDRTLLGFLKLHAMEGMNEPDLADLKELLTELSALASNRNDTQRLEQIARRHEFKDLEENLQVRVSPSRPTSSRQSSGRQMLQSIDQAIKNDQEKQAVQLALALTAADPFPARDHGWRSTRKRTLQNLDRADLLDEYLAALEVVPINDATPASHYWRLFEAYLAAEDDNWRESRSTLPSQIMGAKELVLWLERRDEDSWRIGLSSPAANYTRSHNQTIKLPETVLAGAFLAGSGLELKAVSLELVSESEDEAAPVFEPELVPESVAAEHAEDSLRDQLQNGQSMSGIKQYKDEFVGLLDEVSGPFRLEMMFELSTSLDQMEPAESFQFGLLARATPNPGSPMVASYLTEDNAFVNSYRKTAIESPMKYLDAFMAKNPAIPPNRVSDLLAVLREAKAYDRAINVVKKQMSGGVNQLNQWQHEAMRLFQQAGRLPELVDLIIDLDYQEGPVNRLVRVQSPHYANNVSHIYANLASNLLRQKDEAAKSQAIRLIRHAIDLPIGNSHGNTQLHQMAAELALLLEDQELAIKAVQNLFYPVEAEMPTSPLAVHSARSARLNTPGLSALGQTNHSRGSVRVSALEVIEPALAMGLGEELLAMNETSFQEMIKQQAVGNPDDTATYPDFLKWILLTAQGDPRGYQAFTDWIATEEDNPQWQQHLHRLDPFIPAWIYAAVRTNPEIQDQAMSMALDAQETLLEYWDEAHWTTTRNLTALALTAHLSNQDKERDRALGMLFEEAHRQTTRVQLDNNATVSLVNLMITDGDWKQAEKLYDLLKLHGQRSSSNSYQYMLESLEQAFQDEQAKIGSVAVAAYYQTENEQPVIAYQINPQPPLDPQQRSDKDETLWSPIPFPAATGRYDAELWLKRNDGEKRIARLEKAPRAGLLMPVLDGEPGLMQVRLLEHGKSDKVVTESAWLPTVAGPPTRSTWETARPEIRPAQDWHAQPSGEADQAEDWTHNSLTSESAPFPASRFVFDSGMNRIELQSEPVPMPSDNDLLVNVWIRMDEHLGYANLRIAGVEMAKPENIQFSNHINFKRRKLIGGKWALIEAVVKTSESKVDYGDLHVISDRNRGDSIVLTISGSTRYVDLSQIEVYPLPVVSKEE